MLPFFTQHSTQLVPPALVGSTEVERTLTAEIAKICDEVVVICGLLRKRIKYRALFDGKIVPNHVVIDEVPFTCLIDRGDIEANDRFIISTLDIICEIIGKESNFTTDKTTGEEVAFRYVEKEVVKICIEKMKE